MTRFPLLAALVLVLGFPLVHPPRVFAQDATDLGGRWVLDRQLSQFPPEVGFGVDWLAGGGATLPSSGGRSRSGGAQANPYMALPESEDDAHRVQLLTAEVREPAAHVTIVDTPAAVTITYEREPARTFYPDGRQAVLQLNGSVPVTVTTRRDGDRLEIVYDVEQGRQLRYVLTRVANPRQLIVDAQFLDHGKGDNVRRVYRPMTAAEILEADAPPPPPPARKATPAAPSAPASSQGGAIPAAPGLNPGEKVDSRPDADLRGLTSLNVVVDGLGEQAAACGLDQNAIQTAVSKRLSDAGFKVLSHTTEDTYLYIDIVTAHPSPGSCISRYDVALYAEATARMSYQQNAVLAQVSLLHEGGLSGGGPTSHGADVLKGVLAYVDEFTSRIHNASR
jgi:hypothetical protein